MARASAEDEEIPDELLVVAAILGDLSAFDELASRYRAAVVRTAQSIVGREDAEDVAHEGAAPACNYSHAFRPQPQTVWE